MDASTSNLRLIRYGTQLAGVVVLMIVAGVYARSFAGAPWPPSHPYSGLTLLALGLFAVGSPYLAAPAAGRALAVSAALALIGGGLWLASAWAG